MSGTSLDGIDLSIINTNGKDVYKYIKTYYFKYPNIIVQKLSKGIKEFKIGQNNSLIELSNLITNFYSEKILRISELKHVDLVGFHGQTIYHNPSMKKSIQLGSPQLLANVLQKSVIFDFRSNDLKNNGQGAPLAPVYHRLLVKKLNLELPCCFVNIGGISNISYVDNKNLIGFDTGPGNCLIDNITLKLYNLNFDNKGILASKGKINVKFLNLLLSDIYFKKNYPKSLDKNYFNHYLTPENISNINANDLLTTLCEFTVKSIYHSIISLPTKPKTIIYSGGGVKNLYLVKRLHDIIKIRSLNLNQHNFNTDFVESDLIAFLAARSLYKLPITFPQTTGIKKPLTGGILYKPNYKNPLTF